MARSQWRRLSGWSLPVFLLIASVGSTFLVGALKWDPSYYLLRMVQQVGQGHWSGWFGYGLLHETRVAILSNWDTGLWYAALVLAFLFAHEMGHFVAAWRYGVPCSYPMVIPFPLTPIGTLGAVIVTDPRSADRKMMFDIGIAGPIAGLVVGIPMLAIGLSQLDFRIESTSDTRLGLPLIANGLLAWIRPQGYTGQTDIGLDQLTPSLMAGWVGMLVTGLNMMPVSQLDGGHVIHGLFGRRARDLAWAFIILAIVGCIVTQAYHWGLMIALVIFIGVVHPPTRDDRVPLGAPRYFLGLLPLVIPVVCFTVFPLKPH
jgi:membrane-associated protease RseP (regulator of RpoE activity)